MSERVESERATERCPNPDWSDNCNGTLESEYEQFKGLCQGCMDVIASWSDDGSDSEEGTQQTTLGGGFA